MVLRVPVAEIAAGHVELDTSAAHYVAKVHRLGPGARFLAFDPEQRLEAEATVVDVRRGRVLCDMSEPTLARSVATQPFCLLMGMTKNEAFEWAIREATALGVTEIVPTICARTTVPTPERSSRRAERWHRVVVEGARQCGRGDVPKLHEPTKLADALAAFGQQDAARICFWENAVLPVREVVSRGLTSRAVIVLIGPEGGLTAQEARLAEDNGFECVVLGRYVLRAETAAIAAMGLLRAMWLSEER